MEKRELYAVEGEKLVRKRRTCPRCGAGIFLAEHADRYTCGKCGYTEFKKKK
ncbi:30S ribosomal protein S27ae [Ferroplasma sp.]|uniref:30S ribosomal protein S27ae n=1 Tax=Ferroplasma sp. TaxID=2591003 RepID=UPI00261DFA53|nr:30S ribosomal protein S27ae [Ferroplasma sp.]